MKMYLSISLQNHSSYPFLYVFVVQTSASRKMKMCCVFCESSNIRSAFENWVEGKESDSAFILPGGEWMRLHTLYCFLHALLPFSLSSPLATRWEDEPPYKTKQKNSQNIIRTQNKEIQTTSVLPKTLKFNSIIWITQNFRFSMLWISSANLKYLFIRI